MLLLVGPTAKYGLAGATFEISSCAYMSSTGDEFFVVAYSENVAMSLAGVCFASLGSGIGEISYLALASHYPAIAIAAWSSGTGGAGLIGSFSYALLTEPSMGNLQPKVALSHSTFRTNLTPEDVHTPGLNPKTWIVPKEVHKQADVYGADKTEVNSATSDSNSSSLRVPQRQLSFMQKIQHIGPLVHLMVPLALVYVGEYLINQGVTQLIIFNCSEGFHLNYNAQYRWYQVLYQLGVFLSRSSVKLFELPTWSLFLLPVLQATNFTFFFFEAIYWFTPSIAIIFCLIIFEGLLGGAAYVNTFNKIHKMVSPDVREYSLSVASVGDSIGVNFAGFVAIPLHNYVCSRPMHRH
ncbi:CLN3 protein [Cooperia oncophora]